MNSWFEDRLFSLCFELCLQQNLRESTICQQRTLKNNALFWQKLSMLLEFLKGCALSTICRRNTQLAAILYSLREHVLLRRLAKKIMNMELSTAINGQSHCAECCLEWTVCALWICALLHAWTYHGGWTTLVDVPPVGDPVWEDTRHHLVCASCFQWLYVYFEKER